MTDFRKVLLAVAPLGNAAILDGFSAAMERCVAFADLTTPVRLAAFIGQCAEESASLRTTTEYASGLAYNGRRDLGNVEPGDGPRFKGRGLIQLTGRANYRQAGKDLGLPLEQNPSRAAEFPEAALVAAWFWKTRGLNKIADTRNWAGVTRRINGGENGLSQRRLYIERALAALADVRGALFAVARQEKARGRKSMAAALGASVVAAAAGVAHPAIVGSSTGESASWAAIAALVGVGAGAIARAKRHGKAAAALTDAAKSI
jgi:putative chitinase